MTTTIEDINHEAIERAITGDRGPALTSPELRAAWKRLEDENLDPQEIADTLGVPYSRVMNWRAGGEVVTGRPGTEKPNAMLTPTGVRPVATEAPAPVALAKVATAAAPAKPDLAVVRAPADGSIEDLIARALQSGSKRLVALANRTQTNVTDLTDELTEHEAKAEARAEVERLERELAAAKARLKDPKAAAAAARPSGGEVTMAEVREWAQRQGIAVPAKGIIKKDIVEQYRQATGR